LFFNPLNTTRCPVQKKAHGDANGEFLAESTGYKRLTRKEDGQGGDVKPMIGECVCMYVCLTSQLKIQVWRRW